MAKKAREVEQEEVQAESTEAQVEQETAVELTVEEQAVQTALSADDHIEALTNLRDSDVPGDVLKTVISTFLALTNALGADAPATQHALTNLQNFKSAKVKAAKGPKAPKEPKFNEVAELKKVLAEESPDFQPLLDNDKVSDALKIVITTYTTLAGLESIDQAVVDTAKSALANFGSKSKRKTSGPTEEFNVESGGIIYKNLAAALRAHGHDNEVIEIGDGKKARKIDIAWRAVRGKLLAGELGTAIDHAGHTYTKVAPSADAIGGTRGRQKQAEVESTDETETEAEYE
jgi:hypothetical protein